MTEEQLFYALALMQVPDVGAIKAKTLLSYCGGTREIFQAPVRELLRIPGIGKATVTAIKQARAEEWAEKELKFVQSQGIRIFTFLDEEYPRRLKVYEDCPFLIFYKGKADLNASRQVGIVGTRQPTHYGKSLCENLVEELAHAQVQVVSGLAMGIDIAAHRKCLEVGIPTIGVMGHGFSMIYPRSHTAAARQMCEQGGLISEFCSHAQPDRERFPMRNRIIAALCDALVIVETGLKGGSMITAEIGFSYDKDIFAFPGRVGDPLSAGCHRLIKRNQASLIESGADLLHAMSWESVQREPMGVQRKFFLEISDEEQMLLNQFRESELLHIDELSSRVHQPTSVVSARLLEMEFKGLVRPLPGNRFAVMHKQEKIIS